MFLRRWRNVFQVFNPLFEIRLRSFLSYYLSSILLPLCKLLTILDCSAPVAQLDRAPAFEAVGRRFEPCRAYSF